MLSPRPLNGRLWLIGYDKKVSRPVSFQGSLLRFLVLLRLLCSTHVNVNGSISVKTFDTGSIRIKGASHARSVHMEMYGIAS